MARCTAASLAMCLTAYTASAQDSGRDYRAIVDAYRTGTAVPTGHLNTVTASDLLNWVDAAASPAGGWDWPTLRAAAILHTEQWYQAVAAHRLDSAGRHLEAAARLLGRVQEIEPRQMVFVERWQGFIGDLIRLEDFSGERQRVGVAALDRLRSSDRRREALRLFAAGLDAEREGVERPPALAGDVELWPAWRTAARLYQEALRLDPSLESATLHLGRLRMVQGEAEQAVRLFESVAAAADPRVRYLASLFTGSLAERSGDLGLAEQHYRRGMDAYPHGQAAWLALSQLYSRAGQESNARAVIQALGMRNSAVVEPLWTYLPANAHVFDVLLWLDELRVEVQQ